MVQKSLSGREAREALKAGANKVNNIVKSTLGPQGKNVVSNHINGQVWSTKDGIKVIREIQLSDPFEQAGAKYIMEASTRTSDEAGDATTTTCILSSELINLAHEELNKGKNSLQLRKEIETECEKAIKWVEDNTIKINGDLEKLRQIATISANNSEEIGRYIHESYKAIGVDGIVILEKSNDVKTNLELIPGYSFDRGMINPYFITDQRKVECVLEKPLILYYDKKIAQVQDILPPLEYAYKNQRAILIICADAEGEALGSIIQNVLDGKLRACIVRCPDGGMKRLELLRDMATYTGGEVASPDLGKPITKDAFKESWLGECEKAIIGRNRTILVNGYGKEEEIIQRQEEIKSNIEEAPSDFEKEILRARAASLSQGVAILKIGAATEIEQGDKYDLAEDAILAVRSAIETGYLAGGGISYLKCSKGLNGLLKEALKAPYKQILKSCGEKDRINRGWLHKLFFGESKLAHMENYGFNAKTCTWGNLLEDGVLDSAKVVKNAIRNACSVATMFINIEELLAEFKDA